VDGIAAPGVAVFENVLPDSNGQIRFDFGDPASTSFAAYFSAMKIERNAFVPGDANLDGLVDLADFELLTDHFFSNVPVRQNGDLTFDGFVDYHDFGRWFEIYNAQGAGGTAGSVEVPEPIAGCALIVATVVATLCRSRKLACLVVLLLASGLQTASTYAQLPNFERQGIVIDPVPLTAPPLSFPHYDAIFSSVIDATEHFANPLGNYYLYFGPHDAPGGIFMAYSDSLDGPWSLYDSNSADADLDPVISRSWAGNYSVSHVASPHAMWVPEEDKMFLWYHGENNQTRYATTTDGIHFNYEGVAVDTGDFNGTSEASYARVFRTALPEKDAQYVLMLMGNQSGTRPLYLAWSNDARNWTSMSDPLITPHGNPTDGPQISSPHLLEWEGQKYIAYHQNFSAANPPPGDIWATPITNNFEVAGPPRLLFAAQPGEDLNHVWAPSFISDDDTMYMYYDSGSRLHSLIRYATAPIPQTTSEPLPLIGVPRHASSVLTGPQSFVAGNAVDGDPSTRWSAQAADNQWLYIDLGEQRLIEQLRIDWTSLNARDYSIYVASGDTAPNPLTELDRWDMVAKVTGRSAFAAGGDADGLDGQGGGNADDHFDFVHGTFQDLDGAGFTRALVSRNASSMLGRYLMVYAGTRATAGGPSIWELEVTHSIPAPPPVGIWLQIDRATGQAAIINTGDESVDLVGYTIASGSGSLDPAVWLSRQDQSDADWREANPNSQTLSELKATPGALIAPVDKVYLGRPHAPSIPGFGTSYSDDVTFSYYTSDGELHKGVVKFVGQQILNNLVMLVDPSTGETRVENNSPHTVTLASYEVSSNSESLDHVGWNGLADQSFGEWVETVVQANQVAEATNDNDTVLKMGEAVSLGQLFKAGQSVRDLTFSFRIAEDEDAHSGIVRYGDLASLTQIRIAGDYNEDGSVDAADYTVWRDSFGTTGFGLAADGSGDGRVDQTDYALWKSRFAHTLTAVSVAQAVPEPTSIVFLLIAFPVISIWYR
jgi:hypothetical protein